MENKANANALISQNRAVGIYKNTTVITTGSYLGQLFKQFVCLLEMDVSGISKTTRDVV